MNRLTYSLNHATAETFWKATVFGKSMVQFVGQSVYEWMAKVKDYINYIKGLMASLQETISSYRLQLMQLRGDRLGELNMWMKEETKKLEDQYAGELGKTKEYYDAKALLDELYAEKKKQILEDIKASEEDSGNDKSGSSSSSASGVVNSVNTQDIQQFFNQVEAPPAAPSSMSSSSAVSISVNVEAYDQESTQRWVKDKLMPMLSREFELRG